MNATVNAGSTPAPHPSRRSRRRTVLTTAVLGAGWTTRPTGLGFTASGGWELLDGAGQTVATLPAVASLTALSTATGGGVFIAGPTSVSVRLPAEAAGMYRLSFTPSSSAYPGADFGFTSKSVVVYSDLG